MGDDRLHDCEHEGGRIEAGESVDTRARALFAISFRQRDEVAVTLARAGWHVVAARRADDARQRLVASGAAVVLLDARGAIDDGLSAATALGGPIADIGGALIVLVSKGDADRLGAFHAVGATHFLVSPLTADMLVQLIRFGERHVERIGGARRDPLPGGGEPLGWRYDPTTRSLQCTPALSTLLPAAQEDALSTLRTLPAEVRGALFTALRRLTPQTPATAFAHDMAGVGRVVQHIQRNAATGRIHALVEVLGRAPDPDAVLREALAGVRDAQGAARWIDRRLGEGRVPALLLVALGGLDAVNRSDGRRAGDALLRAAEGRLSTVIAEARGFDGVVARLGGTEFGVLSTAGIDAVQAIAATVRHAFARPFAAQMRPATLSVRSVAVAADAGEDGVALLRRAQDLLPGARAEDPPFAASDMVRTLVGQVARAMTEGEVAVRFQPQVEIASGRIVGVEALARWRHPDGRELGAETLFAAGMRAGVGLALSSHVQQCALRSAARWPATLGQVRLSINVTAEDVAQPGFVDTLLDRVDTSGFPRSRLTIEITESGLMAELGEAARLLAQLRAAGCRVAIDDFGTGYSSLAYLKALPLDYLKIDRRLVQDIVGSPRDRVVIRGVIDMARSLGIAVIAEGVETAEQRDALAIEGCELYQGFLCAGPVPAEELVRLV